MKTYRIVWTWLNEKVFGGSDIASYAQPQNKPQHRPQSQLGFYTACMVSRENWPHN